MAACVRTLVTALVFIVGAGGLAQAQNESDKSKPRLVILHTSLDRTNQTLTIHGIGFDAQAPQVWCETFPMTVLSWTDSDIVVHFPAAVPDGTYRLTVVRANGEKDRDVFHTSVQTALTGPKGDRGPAGATGEPGPAGPKGEAGAPGPKGDTGAAGPKGDTGAAGPKGDTGLKGDTGAAGPKGDTGLKGDAGGAGPKGDTGAAGPQGETGAAGPKGDTGAVGPQGDPGVAGPKGDTGVAGPKGDTGATGAQGLKGDPGAPGATGPMGPIGPQGAQGVQGIPGMSGHEVVFTPFTSFTVNGNQTVALNATCPAGKVAIAGGFDVSGNTASLTPVGSFPFSPDTWRLLVRLSQIGAATFQVRVYALCVAS
jgi:hypothetical protein